MAVPEQTPYIEYTANGVTTDFAVAFQCDLKDKLKVSINGIDQLPADWQFTNGNVVFSIAPISGSVVSIERSTPLKRDTSYSSYDNSFRPETIDIDFDTLWHLAQELKLKNQNIDQKIQDFIDQLIAGEVNGLPAEITARIAVDEQLKASIDAEILRAYTAESIRYTKSETYSKPEIDTAVATVAGGKYSFTTYAKFDTAKATVPANSMVNIDEAPTGTTTWGQGLNTWDGVTLSKSINDPVAQAKIYSDNLTRNYETKYIGVKNKFVVSGIIDGLYMNNTGAIRAAAGWGMSGAIPVVAGNYYTISGLRGSNGLAFYNTDVAVANVTNAIAGSYLGSVLPLTVQAPAGATFMRINLYSASNPTYSNIQVEDGQAVTEYEPNGVYFTLHEDAIVQTIGDNSITINGTAATLKGLLEDGSKIEIDLTLSKTSTLDQANVLNFASIRRNGVTIVNNTDDAAPLHAEGTVIGANHGYAKSTLTATGHTKTNADVGSVWTDGTKEWVIVAVLTDKIIITARSENLYYPTGGGTLTHVSGATNTSDIVSTASANSQWFPVIKNRKLTMTIDGELSEIINKTVGFDDNVTFNESYDIMLKSDMVEWLIANGGVERTSYDAPGTMAVTQSYKFDKELGCIVSYNFTALRDVPKFSDIMVVQSVAMLGSNGLVKYYIPKSKEFVQNGVTYNFSNPTAISSLTLSSDILFNAAKNDDGANPVDHLIQLNNVIGFSIGFLPQADAAFDVRPTNCSRYYFQIFASSKKVYPRLIDRADLTSLTAGQSFSCTAYRKYFSKSTARTAKYVVDDCLYLHWHTATVDVIDTPPQFIGREFTIVEKSSNVQLNGGIASNRLIAKVDSTKNYGYAVLKFN